MKLRGHHLFCMALFSGHGYDQSFTAAMNHLLLERKSGSPAQLLIGVDSLCAACPNRMEDGGCLLGTENVEMRDRAALRVLGFQEGESVSWAETQKRFSKVTEEDFQAVCGDCRWQKGGLCSFKLLQERTKESACN